MTKRTPGRFRTRVITHGVVPSLHVDYKQRRIKQDFKEGRALRTETTINNTRDFGIGKRLANLPAPRAVGFQANRRLLDPSAPQRPQRSGSGGSGSGQARVSHDCAIGEEAFGRVTRPIEVDGQRAPALRYADPRVQALCSVLVLCCVQPRGFATRDLRELLAPLLGLDPGAMTPGRLTYDLRRLRLHGLIERLPGTHRYRVTRDGLRIALFFTRTYARVLRPGLSQILPLAPPGPAPLRAAFDKLDTAIGRYCTEAKLAS